MWILDRKFQSVAIRAWRARGLRVVAIGSCRWFCDKNQALEGGLTV